MPWNPNETDWIAQAEGLAGVARPHHAVVPAAAAAADYEIAVFKAGASGIGTTLTRLSIIADVAIAGAATNYQTLQFRQWRGGALVGTVPGATTYATTANLAALTELALFSGAFALQPGDIITLQSVHAGTGAALPALTAVVEASPSV